MPRVRRELLDAAAALGDADPAMRSVIDDVGPPDLRRGRPRANHFAELARAICFQQVAAWYCWRATDTILPEGRPA